MMMTMMMIEDLGYSFTTELINSSFSMAKNTLQLQDEETI